MFFFPILLIKQVQCSKVRATNGSIQIEITPIVSSFRLLYLSPSIFASIPPCLAHFFNYILICFNHCLPSFFALVGVKYEVSVETMCKKFSDFFFCYSTSKYVQTDQSKTQTQKPKHHRIWLMNSQKWPLWSLFWNPF